MMAMGADADFSPRSDRSAPLPKSNLPETRKVYSITQYNRSVERKMREFPRVWVKGVISQLNVRGKIVYLTLAEFAEGDERPMAVLETTLWASELELFNLRFARLPTPLSLRVEMKVALLLESNFYVPSGRFQPRVVDVDEAFTLGEMSLTRQKILERLVAEGLLGRNKALELCDPPLRVGLVTAAGSAAYQDFTSVLLQSGYSFRMYFAAARMQGEATETTVLRAIEKLARMPLDVICLVRGGGSKTDLVYFDSERICRAIAQCRIPVITGIGHEIDNSLADLVAYADKITPTDCAKFLEGMAAGCYGRLCEMAAELGEAWRMELQQGWHDLAQRAATLKHEWEGRRATEELRCRERTRALAGSSRRLLHAEAARLQVDTVGLKRGPGKILRLESLRFANRLQSVGHAWRSWRAARARGLRETKLRLGEKIRSLLRRQDEALGLKERLVNAADPARMLGLGFSLLATEDGKIVRSVDQVKSGDVLVNRLRDGSVESKVVSKKESK
jgi:exodeoxyribonuclease VII large subunit